MAIHPWIAQKAVYRQPLYNPSKSQVVFFSIYKLEGEVNNGGFDQYFFNSAPFIDQVVDSLKTIGAEKTAEIAARAFSVFGPEGPSPDRAMRWEQMDKWTDEEKELLSRLDDEFYAYPDDLALLLAGYCRKNREAFF